MDSCHIFNFLFGTRKATSELRKCFSGGQTGRRKRAGKKSPAKQDDNQSNQQAQVAGEQAAEQQRKTTSNGSSPLKQIQLKLVNFAAGCSESSVLSALSTPTSTIHERNLVDAHQEHPTSYTNSVDSTDVGQLEAKNQTTSLACGIFEAQLVRLDEEEKLDSSQPDENNNNNNSSSNNNISISTNNNSAASRAPLKVIVENPANKLDNLDELTEDVVEISQQKINVYDNPLVVRNETKPVASDKCEGSPETGRLSNSMKNDKRERSERVRDLVKSFEITRQQEQTPRSPAVAVNQGGTLARRPSKPPDTPPKSNRARCLNLQLSLRKPTSVSALFQDEAFLARHFFARLAPIDRCAAAQVCRRWRDILYADKNYWKDLVGVIDCTQLRREHLANCIMNTLQTARLKHQQHNQQRMQILNAANNHPAQNHLQQQQHNQNSNNNNHHQLQDNQTSNNDPNNLSQLDQDEIWRIQELCNRYTMRSFSNGLSGGAAMSHAAANGQTNQTPPNRTSSASQHDQNDATTTTTTTTTTQQTTSGIANSKSSSSQISSSTLSSISISSLLSPLSESSRVDSIREKLYTALDERGFDSICLFGATDDDIEDLAAKTRPNGAQKQIKLGRLSNCSISDRGLEAFVSTFGQIEELELTGCNEITNAIDLRGLKQLRRLIITDCINIADGLAQRLVEIFHQLEVLVVQAYHLTDAFLEYVSLNSDTSRLKRLELPNCKEITNTSALTIAKHFQSLDALSMSGSTRINDDGIEILCEHLDTVSCLDLGWLKIGDLSLECLACDLCHLRELILDRNVHITDLGLGYLATMADLTLLYVRWCPQLTDKSIKSISNMRALTRLSLAGLHQITARGILSLLDSPQLEELELTNCPAVTCELQQFLSAKMPNCNIIY